MCHASVCSHECMFLGSLSRHNKDLERWTLQPLACHSSWVLDKSCYSSQANQCYSSILFRRQQERERESPGERVHEKALWLLLLYVFSSIWACPMKTGLSQECCLFCLKSSLWSQMSCKCMFLGSLSRHDKDLERRTLKPSASQLSGLGQTVLQLLGKSVLQLHFIQKTAGESKTRREESGGVHGEGV